MLTAQLSNITEIARVVIMALVFLSLVTLSVLAAKYPRYGGYMMLPGMYLINLGIFFLYRYAHYPLDAHEIAVLNLWSLGLYIQVLLSLLGAGLVLLCQKKL